MKLRNLQRAFLAIAVALCSWLPSLAQEFEVDYLKYNILSTEDKTVEVDGLVDEYIENVVIPSEAYYDGVNYSVVAIADKAFENCSFIKSVDIPGSIKTIGKYAFYGCSNLTSVFIPYLVKSIDPRSFAGCFRLKTIEVAEANSKYDSREGCNAIIETATNALIVGCSNTVIPQDIVKIGDYAFFANKTLQLMEIPNSVETIGKYAFGSAFELRFVVFGNSVRFIDDYAFTECDWLTSIDIPDSVESISQKAFWGCNRLNEVKIGASVAVVGDEAFGECGKLNRVYCRATTPPVCGNSVFGSETLKGSLYVPQGYGDAYESSETWKEFATINEANFAYDFEDNGLMYKILSENDKTVAVIGKVDNVITDIIIPDKVTWEDKTYSVVAIADKAFYYCTELTSVIFSDSLKTIGYDAFYYCSGLTSIDIPNSVEYIGENAFGHCEELETVTLGNSLKTIERNTFNTCYSLTSIDIPDSVESIGDKAFCNCQSMQEVKIGASVKSIGDYAFYSNHPLKSIDIPNSVQFVGYSSFSCCYNLTAVTLGNSVKTIDSYAFDYCSALKSVEFGASVETIGDGAFGDCIKLEEVTLGNSLKTIGIEAFKGCSALKSVEFGASVESIGEEAFWGCYELREVYSRATTPPVCTGIFEQETTMGTLFVPTGCKPVYAETFPWNAFWTIEELGSLGVEGVATDEVEVKAVGGSIVFDSATEANIYSSAGILVASGMMTETELPAGLYIVVAGGKSHKIIVK